MFFFSSFKKIKFTAVISHLTFWLIIYFLYYYFYSRISGSAYLSFVHLSFSFPIMIVATYTTIYLLIPKLINKDYIPFLIGLFYTLLSILFLELLINFYFLLTPSKIEERVNPAVFDIYLRFAGVLLVVLFASLLKLLEYWYSLRKRNINLEKEKLEAELALLKSQLHPHFLFNTLNNLYALTLKKSDKSPEIVLKLSQMLDFVLYRCNDDKIFLNNEINFIKDYLDLEKLRYPNDLKISISLSEKIENVLTPPLIFFPLVENCVKHGINKKDSFSVIELSWEMKDSQIIFRTVNRDARDESNPKEVRKGVGLINITKRLKLIYGNDYKLDIKRKNGYFIVTLSLPLEHNYEY